MDPREEGSSGSVIELPQVVESGEQLFGVNFPCNRSPPPSLSALYNQSLHWFEPL